MQNFRVNKNKVGVLSKIKVRVLDLLIFPFFTGEECTVNPLHAMTKNSKCTCMWDHFYTCILYFSSWYYISLSLIEITLFQCKLKKHFYKYFLQLNKRCFQKIYDLFFSSYQYQHFSLSHSRHSTQYIILRVQAIMKQSKLGCYGWSGSHWILYLLQDMSWHSLPHTADPHCW